MVFDAPLRSCAAPLCSGLLLLVWVLRGTWSPLLAHGALSASLSPMLRGFRLCRSFPCFFPLPVLVAPCNPLCLRTNTEKARATSVQKQGRHHCCRCRYAAHHVIQWLQERGQVARGKVLPARWARHDTVKDMVVSGPEIGANFLQPISQAARQLGEAAC